jgi:DNA-directed RNA polymerase I subunit RPA49
LKEEKKEQKKDRRRRRRSRRRIEGGGRGRGAEGLELESLVVAMETPQSHSTKKKKEKTKEQSKVQTEVVLDFLPTQAGHASPFIGYFPSGFDPDQYRGKDWAKDPSSAKNGGEEEAGEASLEARGYQNTEKYKTRQHQLIVTPSGSGVDFVGSNFYGEGAVWQPGNYALAVYNKDSGTLQLLPIAGSKVTCIAISSGISGDVLDRFHDVP